MSIYLFGQKADRTHENHMLRAFIQELKADWQHADKDIILIANSIWNNAEIDLVCILPSAILLVDFKDYSGHLIAAENGPWMTGDIEVKGGSKTNPYHQLRDNKFAVMGWLTHNNLLKDRNVTHISAAVVFTGPITGKPNLSGKVSRWLHTADLSNCSAMLADLASKELEVFEDDIRDILRVLGVVELTCDYGQINRGVIKPPVEKRKPSFVSSPAISQPVKKPVIHSRSAKSDWNENKQNATANKAGTSQPTQKNRFPKILKSAAIIGGIFLTMALVSQIYPISGLSNPLTGNERKHQLQQVEPLTSSPP